MTKVIPRGPFGEFDKQFELRGFVGLPVNGMAPAVRGWTRSAELTADERIERRRRFAHCGIGLLAGTALSTGRSFGFVDVDEDRLVPFVSAVLAPSPSAKFGRKGLTIFTQVERGVRDSKLKRKGAAAPVVEIFATKGMTVVPPSIHPSGKPYEWRGKSLLEIDHGELPVLTAEKIAIVAAVVRSEHAWTIVEGGADVKAHDAMLSLTSSGIADLTDDLGWLSACLNALFHPEYRGDTKTETLEMLRSAKAKGLGAGRKGTHTYDPGDEGPVPLGYLEDGRFVFYDQLRHILIAESSNRLITHGTLLNLAPSSFWHRAFPKLKDGKVVGVDALDAGDTLMESCRARGGFDVSRVRGRGVYVNGDGSVITNFGGKTSPDSRHTYVCHLPLPVDLDGPTADPASVLDFLRKFEWTSPSAPYLLLGWTVTAVICGALAWRTHVFLTGAKNTGKSTLVTAIFRLLECLAVALDGQSTEAGIRQKLGADSRPVILDEFESDQNLARMKQVVKLVRSASSGDLSIARGTPEGKPLEFCIRSSFLLAAINPIAVTAADRSRIVVLPLNRHDNDKAVAREIAEFIEALEGVSPSWCRQAIERTATILENIKTLRRVFPPCDSRHALNMSNILGAAWTMLNARKISEAEAEALIEEHWPFIDELSEAHESDDAQECFNALLQFQVRSAGADRLLGHYLADIKRLAPQPDPKHEEKIALGNCLVIIDQLGLKWSDGGLVVANSHRSTAEIFAGTLWEPGNWGTSLKRLQGARSAKQRRFAGDVRSQGTWIPADLIPDHEEPEGGY